jgi:hypothetical protein
VQLDAALSQLQAHGTSHSEKDDEIARLVALLKEAGEEIDRLRADKRGAEQALDKAVGEHAACEQARQAAEEGREAACTEREASVVAALAAQGAQAAAEEARRKAESEAGRLSTDLMDSKGKVVELANENVALMSELTKLRTQLAEQEGQHSKITKMVEKAMASSVRLCVVAPTVNVQVAGKSAKFKGGLEDGKLRSFLVDNVLSKYVFCHTIVLPSFLVCDDVSVSLSIYYCLFAFSDTTWHESNHHLPLNQSSIDNTRITYYNTGTASCSNRRRRACPLTDSRCRSGCRACWVICRPR